MAGAPRITTARIAALAVLGLIALLALWSRFRDADQRNPQPPSQPVSSAKPVEYEAVDFSSLSSWTINRDGDAIRILGRLHSCDGTEQWLPRGLSGKAGDMVLYRFVNTCCPGHSVPAVIGVRDDEGMLALLEGQDQWLYLQGRWIAADPQQPGSVGSIELTGFSLPDMPPDPAYEQLYPPSKMGAPCAGSRPDIAYPPQ